MPEYVVKGGVVYRIVTDHLGSVRQVVNTQSGVIVQQLAYDENGMILADSNASFIPFGYAGGLFDLSTKLVRFGARDFDAKTGRWTFKDPIRFQGGDANLYQYVNNDPVNFIDPKGKYGFLAFDLIVGAIYALADYDVRSAGILAGAATIAVIADSWTSAPSSGETAFTKAGHEAHKAYDPGSTYKKEFRLPSGKRPDAVDFDNQIVRELKSNNPRAISRWLKQVESYRQELEAAFGGKWRAYVDVY